MTMVYGIPNCDSVKKAVKWLEANAIPYRFHDFRKNGLEASLLQSWLAKVPYTTLINQRSTTWKLLSDEEKNLSNNDKVIALCIKYPTLIKRPVVENGDNITFGFNDSTYTQLFK